MSDIFISYSRVDKARAKRIAEVIEGDGWTVWWDDLIRTGSSFDRVIEESLGKVKCVIVLWSVSSVKSDWVRAEASYALEKNKLIPIFVESGIELPVRFRLINTLSLVDWNGETDSPEFTRLLDDVNKLVGEGSKTKNVIPPNESDALIDSVPFKTNETNVPYKSVQPQHTKRERSSTISHKSEISQEHRVNIQQKSVGSGSEESEYLKEDKPFDRILCYMRKLFDDSFDNLDLEKEFRTWRETHHWDNRGFWNYYDAWYRRKFMNERDELKKIKSKRNSRKAY